LNRKDVEDFLTSLTGIHVPSYNQWLRRYALSKLMNADRILRWTDWRKLNISIFLPRFKKKTPEILNTKHVDIFLRFPMNICVPCSDKQSNGQGHWNTVRGKLLTKI
jgi:hypothetical protein